MLRDEGNETVKNNNRWFSCSLGRHKEQWWKVQMLVDKQNELMSDLLFTVHQHGGDDVTCKPPKGLISQKATLHVQHTSFVHSVHFFAVVLHDYNVKAMLHKTIRNDDFWRNTASQHCFEWLQHCSSIATLCCATNRCCESSRVTSP